MTSTERSASRGRELLASSGRGGAGNIRSMSRDAMPDDDGSNPRGREFDVSPKVMSSGRGGAGNIRSPSESKGRAPSSGPDARERELIDKHIKLDETTIHSAGRGGIGNIRSTSRSRSRPPEASHPHSVGRGGAGNMTILEGTDPAALANAEEAERKSYSDHQPHLHSTGRGGQGNLTSLDSPADAKLAHHDAEHNLAHSTGRGGAGNIYPDHETRSNSRGREHHKGLIGSIVETVRDLSTSRTRTKSSQEHQHHGAAHGHSHLGDTPGENDLTVPGSANIGLGNAK